MMGRPSSEYHNPVKSPRKSQAGKDNAQEILWIQILFNLISIAHFTCVNNDSEYMGVCLFNVSNFFEQITPSPCS